MTRQKSFKREVRSRMAKTGERYAAARQQLISRAERGEAHMPAEQAVAASQPAVPASQPAVAPEPPLSDDALRRATGRGWNEWLGVLDAWGAAERRHPEIARWLSDEQGVDGWWAQSITVGYERARGLRGKHEMGTGFQVSINRTLHADVERLAEAFTDPDLRQRWLAGADLHQRPGRGTRTLRFDWGDTGSRVAVFLAAKGAGKAVATVQHERLIDADTAEKMKTFWRERLDALKQLLESER